VCAAPPGILSTRTSRRSRPAGPRI
jgi:hypothetical protein